jgi:hypothetical protein
MRRKRGSLDVHPAAGVLPMMADDELDALAADIRANGLREPIVVLVDRDRKKSLLDGRNRFQACKKARVKPVFREVTIDDVGDPAEFVIAKNLNRRHLIKQQRAMVVAMIYPDAQPGPSAASRSASNLGISGELVRQCRAVLRADRVLAERVLQHEIPLGQAFASVNDGSSASSSVTTAETPFAASVVRPQPTRPRDPARTPPAARSQPPEPPEREVERAPKGVCAACGRPLEG